MKNRYSRKGRWLIAFGILIATAVVFGARAGSFLILDAPQHSDIIIVLAGETDRRPQRALDLLAQQYAHLVVLDVPTNAKLYEFTQIDLAQKYIQDLPHPDSMSICPIN